MKMKLSASVRVCFLCLFLLILLSAKSYAYTSVQAFNDMRPIAVLEDVQCEPSTIYNPLPQTTWRCQGFFRTDWPREIHYQAELEGQCVGLAGALESSLPRLVMIYQYNAEYYQDYVHGWEIGPIRCYYLIDLGVPS